MKKTTLLKAGGLLALFAVPAVALPPSSSYNVISAITATISGALTAGSVSAPTVTTPSLNLGGSTATGVGTSAGQLAAGNDSRIVNSLQKGNNLSDLTNAANARSNLGLGNSATTNVGTTAGTVAAGDDSRIVGALQTSNASAGLVTATNGGGSQTLAGWMSSIVFGTPTVSSLRAYPRVVLFNNSIITTAGYYNPGDNGGGDFVWSSASAATDDGFLVVNPTGNAGNGRWLRILNGPTRIEQAGAKCDATTDDAAAINKVTAVIRSLPYNIAYVPNKTCAIGSTITSTDWSNSRFLGMGTGTGPGAVPAATAASQDGSTLKWIGANNGTMFDWQSPAATRPNLTANAEIRSITLDGAGLAGTGLYARGLSACFLNLKVRNVKVVGVDIDVYNGGGADVQLCSSDYIGVDLGFPNSVNADGIVLGPGNSYNNVHHNTWGGWAVIHQAGTGIKVGNADTNVFIRPQAQWMVDGTGTRTGPGLDLRASPNALGPGNVTQAARDNTFVGASIPSGTFARAGSFGLPTYGNMMVGFVQGSAEPSPVIEAGAKLDWFSSTGEWHITRLYPNQQQWKSPGDYMVMLQNSGGGIVGYFGIEGIFSGVPTNSLRIRADTGGGLGSGNTPAYQWDTNNYIYLPGGNRDYANNAAAVTGGVPVNGVYYNTTSQSYSRRQ